MTKRKRETADEESAALNEQKIIKKQKTSTTRASKAASEPLDTEASAQVPDRKKEKLTRRLAKREKKALKSTQRNESGRSDGIKTGEHDGNTVSSGIQERKPLEKGRAALSKKWHKSKEGGKEGGQNLTKKHRSKKEKRKDRNEHSSGKKSKERAVEMATWKVSDPLGGQMLDVDPIFSPDEK